LAGHRSLQLGGTHPAGHCTGADRPLILSGGGSHLARALSPLSFRAQSPTAGATATLQCHGEATTRTTPTCCSSRPPHWRHFRSTTARATGPHRSRRQAPPPSTSCCGCRYDRSWRSSTSCAALCVQCASSPSWPCSGYRSPPPREAPWPEQGGRTSTTTTRRCEG
jgi:hypothetical protein